MTEAEAELLTESIEQGQVVYAENCVVCHGADGQGISAYPGLANEGVRSIDYDDIFKVIERGRYNTAMAATVGLPVAIISRMILEEEIRMTGVQLPIHREIYGPVLEELKTHGISFREEEVEMPMDSESL